MNAKLAAAFDQLDPTLQRSIEILINGLAAGPGLAVSAGELLNATEVMRLMGIGHTTFATVKKQLRHLEVSRPVGQRKYSRALVEQFLAGESTVRFIRRESAVARG